MSENNNGGFVFRAGDARPQQPAQPAQQPAQPEQPIQQPMQQPIPPVQPRAAQQPDAQQPQPQRTRTGGYPAQRSGGYPAGRSGAAPAGQKRQPAQPKRKKAGKGRSADAYGPQKPRKKRGLLIFLVLLVLIVGGVFAYGYLFFSGPTRAVLSSSGRTYEAADKETFVRYITHPSLNAGDTISLTGAVDLDIDEDLNGFLSAPLVNIEMNGGSLTLRGGTALFTSGRSDSVSMDGVAVDGTEIYVEAPVAKLSWGNLPDSSNVNAAQLNGTSHSTVLDVMFTGSKLKIPITVTNESSSALNGCEVQLYSDIFAFSGGNTIKANIQANSETQLSLSAVAVQAGRGRVTAVVTGSAGERVAYGESEYYNILGNGYYAGDMDSRTVKSKSEYTGTPETNVKGAYDNGMSFLCSVETNDFGESLTQDAVNGIVGARNGFLQIPSLEIGNPGTSTLFILAYDYPRDAEIPDSEYYQNLRNAELNLFPIAGFPANTYRLIGDAVAEVKAAGGIAVIPHPFAFDCAKLYMQYDEGQDPPYSGNWISTEMAVGGIDVAITLMRNLANVTALDILPSTSRVKGDDMPFSVGVNVWDNINSKGQRKVYGVSTGLETQSALTGSNFIKAYMPTLSENGYYSALRSGNLIATNGPDVRFELGGVQMGGELFIETEGEKAVMKVFAFDNSPLTSVKIRKFNITNNSEQLDEVPFVDLDLKGQGLYSYEYREEVDLTPGCYYRVEVRSESSKDKNDGGMAFSNPIWVSDGNKEGAMNNTSIRQMDYEFGVAQLPMRLLFASSFNTKIHENSAGVDYIDAHGMFTPNALSVDAYENVVQVDYHPLKSDSMADYVTVRVQARDGSSTVKTLYVVN